MEKMDKIDEENKEAKVEQEETQPKQPVEEPVTEQPAPAQPEQKTEGQYIPPQQYAPAPAPEKNGHGYVVVIVIVVVVIFGLLPVLAFLFLGGYMSKFLENFNITINGDTGQIEAVVRDADDTANTSVVGVWDCMGYDTATQSKIDAKEFENTLVLNKDGSFEYGQYGDLLNNSYSGKYSYEKEDKKHDEYDYYMLKFSDVEMTLDGEPSETEGLQNLEMGISRKSSGKRNAVAMFANYNTYYCAER